MIHKKHYKFNLYHILESNNSLHTNEYICDNIKY